MGILSVAAGTIMGPGRLYAELAVAGALVVGLGVQTAGKWDAEKDEAVTAAAFSAYQAKAEKDARDADQKVRAIELDTNARLEGIRNGAEQRIAVAAAAAASAAAASDQLRSRVAQAVAAARRSCPGVAAPTAGSATASDPIGVLADVLGRADARAGILASESDKRRVRAVACEDAYELNRENSLKASGR